MKVFERKDVPLDWDYDDEADTLYLSFGKPKAAVGLDIGEGVISIPEGGHDMKVQHDRADDVLTIHLSDSMIDHAEETDGIIVHFSPDDHPVLLEVLEASDFLSRLTKITATAEPGRVVPL